MPQLDERDDTDEIEVQQQRQVDADDTPNPQKTVEAAELFLYSKTGRDNFDGEDLREWLAKPEIRKGSEGYADSLIATIEREEREAQEARALAAQKRQEEEFESELEKRKAEIRAERQKAAAEEVQTARDAALRAQAEAELEDEVAVGAGGEPTALSQFRHLSLQRDGLDYRSDEANEIREQQIELAASMESGDERTADVDPEEFERLLSEGRS